MQINLADIVFQPTEDRLAATGKADRRLFVFSRFSRQVLTLHPASGTMVSITRLFHRVLRTVDCKLSCFAMKRLPVSLSLSETICR